MGRPFTEGGGQQLPQGVASERTSSKAKSLPASPGTAARGAGAERRRSTWVLPTVSLGFPPTPLWFLQPLILTSMNPMTALDLDLYGPKCRLLLVQLERDGAQGSLGLPMKYRLCSMAAQASSITRSREVSAQSQSRLSWY